MRPVRVSFVIDNLGRAGTESQLLALIRHLDPRRVEPSLVLLDGLNEESRSLEPDCDVLRLGVTKLASRTALAAAVTLHRHWRRTRPDVAQVYFLDPAYFAVPVAKLVGVPRVVRVRNNLGYWLSRKHRLLGRAVRPWIDATLTNTREGAAKLSPADRPFVIENGVDLDRYAGFQPPMSELLPPRPRFGGEGWGEGGEQQPLPVPGPLTLSPEAGERGPDIRIGCVANLRAVKNIDGLLRAAKTVIEKFPHVRFAVAGEGDQREALERLRGELGLQDRFDLPGSVADVPAFLKACDLFVLPSHSEGMSNALLEAVAAGRAVVATAVGGTPGLLHDAGVLVPPGDDSALSAALIHVLSNLQFAQELGAKAKRRAEAFGRPAMVERFVEFWHGLLQRRPAVAGPQGVHRVAAPQVRGDLLQVP